MLDVHTTYILHTVNVQILFFGKFCVFCELGLICEHKQFTVISPPHRSTFMPLDMGSIHLIRRPVT